MSEDRAAEIKNLVEAWVLRLNMAVAELRELGVNLQLSVKDNILDYVFPVDISETMKQSEAEQLEDYKAAYVADAYHPDAISRKVKPKDNG